MTTISKIWEELESDKTSPGMLLLRRLGPEVAPPVFGVIRRSTNQIGIGVKLESYNTINLTRYNKLKEIDVELTHDEKTSGRYFILILHSNNRHQDVFEILCADLIKEISPLKDEDDILKILFNRLEKWNSLFERALQDGLTPEEQRGLYGELFFLRKWLTKTIAKSKCIEAWVGPERELRDFQIGDWALEVKTSRTNSHQKVLISSERQLDPTNISNLFLYHLSLDVQQNNGENLNSIIKSIKSILLSDISALSDLNNKLLHSGYFPHHFQLYEKSGYQIRQENIYFVRGTFPRIDEKDLRKGVGDVKYTIILSDCSDFIVSEDFIFHTIN